MSAMTPEQARAYARRWDLVRDVEAAELRSTSMEAKLGQLATLMRARELFEPDPDREAQIRVVRERWARLRRSVASV